MRIDILTLFPEMFAPLNTSIIGKARDAGTLDIQITDIRTYSADKHSKCDDYPFGGGAGMVMTPQPVCDCINAIDPQHSARRIYLSPKGRIFNQKIAEEFASEDRILFLCGHYEGVDQRALDLTIDEELSVGDYVLTGGEIPAMLVTDCIARLIPGVLGSENSSVDESISGGMLEYPQYTRPQEYEGVSVPEVLLSGHHANIEKWRRKQSRELTAKRRPDLMNIKNTTRTN